MGDIVERLRSNDGSCDWDETIALHEEAADEIERLRLELSATHDMAATLEADVLRLRAERDALRAVVTDWLKFAKDVQPGCAAGADWLEGLRKRSDAALAARGKDE